MREIMQIQPRFEKRQGKRAKSLLEHRRFRAAYDLMLLRQELGEVDADLAKYWTDVQKLPEHQRTQTMDKAKRRGKPRRRKRTRKVQQ